MEFFNPYAEIETHVNRLPHWQQDDVLVFVTWRLADSIPKNKLAEWVAVRDVWLKHHPMPWDAETETEYHKSFSNKLDDWLDEGCGSCVLKDPVNSSILADALHHFDGERYGLDSFVVMPNHVHVLFQPLAGHEIEAVLKSWKGFSAHEINKRHGQQGTLWQKDYWDRLVRNESHLFKCREYIRENPEKAMLREGEFVLFEKSATGMSPPR